MPGLLDEKALYRSGTRVKCGSPGWPGGGERRGAVGASQSGCISQVGWPSQVPLRLALACGVTLSSQNWLHLHAPVAPVSSSDEGQEAYPAPSALPHDPPPLHRITMHRCTSY